MPCKTHLEPRTNASSDSPRPCNACTCVYKANVSRDLQQRQQFHKLPADCQLLPAGLEPFGHGLKSSTRSPSPSWSPWASLGLRPLPRITLVSGQVGARYWRRKHCIGRRLLPASRTCVCHQEATADADIEANKCSAKASVRAGLLGVFGSCLCTRRRRTQDGCAARFDPRGGKCCSRGFVNSRAVVPIWRLVWWRRSHSESQLV